MRYKLFFSILFTISSQVVFNYLSSAELLNMILMVYYMPVSFVFYLVSFPFVAGSGLENEGSFVFIVVSAFFQFFWNMLIFEFIGNKVMEWRSYNKPLKRD